MALLLLSLLLACASSSAPLVTLPQGQVRGVAYSDAAAYGFLGIPYANDVGGSKRWTDAVPRSPWSPRVLNATSFAPGCPQRCNLPPHTCPAVQSEDCLSLNVYRPAACPANHLPVMVYFPGGRFEQGASGTILYDGRFLAAKTNTVIITVNYRLGALGFAYLQKGGGNFGVRDQRLALQWVQLNAALFCGDKTRVTIFGQSAGASSVTYHQLSAQSAGLFKHAIAQSNPAGLPWRTVTLAKSLGKRFSKDMGCKDFDLDCMRAAPVSKVLDAQTESQRHFSVLHPLSLFLPWDPIIADGDKDAPADALPAQPLHMYAEGQYPLEQPLVLGSVGNESNIFIYEGFGGEHISEDVYLGFVADVFGIHGPKVLKQYPVHKGDNVYDVMTALGTDFIFLCPMRNIASSRALHSPGKTHLYWFNHVLSFSKVVWGPNYTMCYDVTCHGSPLALLWDGFPLLPQIHPTPQELALSADMDARWTNFAHTGSVGAHWPAYTPSSDATYHFGTPSSLGVGPNPDKCDFWDSIGYGAVSREKFFAVQRR